MSSEQSQADEQSFPAIRNRSLPLPPTEGSQNDAYLRAIPPEILEKVSAPGGGLVVLVTGAGCSMESPTNLLSGAAYSQSAYESLVDDGVLAPDSSSKPWDLSELADLVYEQTGSQLPLTRRLPRSAWRAPTPNVGHFAAAALLVEGAFRAIVTLNYDTALQIALAMLGLPPTVTIAKGPEEHSSTNGHALIYLHRSAESPEETWILRKTDLDGSWRSHWEEMVTAGVLSAPVTLFAGLGSPAAVLTDTVTRLAKLGRTKYYLADPYPGSDFQAALQDNLAGILKMGWSSVMNGLASRLAKAQVAVLRNATRGDARTMDQEPNIADDAAQSLGANGLEHLGRTRARWLLHDREYLADGDAVQHERLADLLVIIAEIASCTNQRISYPGAGWVQFTHSSGLTTTVQCVHGAGTRNWRRAQERVSTFNEGSLLTTFPRVVLTAGLSEAFDPIPTDLVYDDDPDDLIRGPRQLVQMSAADVRLGLRSDPADLIARMSS